MPTFPPSNLGDIIGLGRGIIGGGLGLRRNTTQVSPTSTTESSISRPNTIIRNPRQSPSTFDIGGINAVRPKGTFYARFKRGANPDGIAYWERDHGFLVKTVEQPTITPKIEEVNQYNRKRQVVTGYTFAPINISLFDTADAMVLRMWQDYARYYFADFKQTKENYAYDVVPLEDDTKEMRGADIGYGFSPAMDATGDLSGDTQFYFQSLEIFQVFRNAYTKITLVNPRISSFSSDELDYSTMDPVSHRMQISYEVALYDNGGAPQKIDGDLAVLFRDIRLHGDVINLPTSNPGVDVTNLGGQDNQKPGVTTFGEIAESFLNPRSTSNLSGLGGVLGAFGNFNFGQGLGTLARSVIGGNTSNLPSELIQAATGNSQLATLVNMATSGQSRTALSQQFLSGAMRAGGISPSLYDAAAGAFAAANGDRNAAGVMAQRVIGGIMASSSFTSSTAARSISNVGRGISIPPSAMSVVNRARSVTSFLGRRF